MKDTDFNKLNQFTVFGLCYIPKTLEATDYIQMYNDDCEIIESEYCLIPENENAVTTLENSVVGQVLSFEECGARDLRLHRCYMSFLAYVWDYLPDNFKTAVPKNIFYIFLKHLKKNYDVVYRFRDDKKRLEIAEFLIENKKNFRLTYKSIAKIAAAFGRSELIEYESISFGRMSEMRFREYIREQLPFIYSEVIGRFYIDETYDSIIQNIENDYEKFFSKLNSK
jgi:hypothetical protein